jgi:DNA-directed RNA polymerase subunit RPC12/RpoP
MAIQFTCTHCGHPIEVDDQHAGQTAACPYCHHVIAVPQESTYRPEAAVTARPATDSPSPGFEGHPFPAPPSPMPRMAYAPVALERQQRAVTYGNYALVCSGIVLALFVGVLAGSIIIGAGRAATLKGGTFSFRQMTEEFQNVPGAMWLGFGEYGMVFVALVGLVLAIVSLTQSRAGNWRGWVGLAVCGGTLGCFCAMAVLVVAILSRGGGLAVG